MLTKNFTDLKREVEHIVTEYESIQYHYRNKYAANSKGCCITALGNYDQIETRFGIPIMLLRITEGIIGRLWPEDADAFFAALPDAVESDGRDLSRVSWQFLALELRKLPPLEEGRTKDARLRVIDGVDLLAAGKDWPEAAAARDSAYRVSDGGYIQNAATIGAARTAAANGDAAEAAFIADSAAESIYSLTHTKFEIAERQRDTLLQLIKEA
jgi:hypothetical protein